MTAKNALRTGALVLSGHVAVAVVGVGALRIYTELAPPGVFGEANLLLSALGLGMQVVIAPFTASQLRFHTQAQARGEAGQFTRESLVWALRAALLLAIACSVGFSLWQQWHGRSPEIVAAGASAIWLIVMTARNVLMSRLQAERRQATYTLIQVFEAIFLACLTALALKQSATIGSFMTGQTVAIVLLLLPLARLAPWPKVSKDSLGRVNSGFLSKVLSYGAPFVPMSLLSWVANLADRYAVAFLLGATAVGEYVAPFAIASRGMALVNVGLNDFFRPILFDAENQREPGKARRVFRAWIATNVCLSAAALLFLYFAGGLVSSLLLAKEYRVSAVGIMMWVALGYGVFGINQIFETRLLSLNRSSRLLPSMALGAVTNILFSLILVSRNGIIGAAQATCASFVLQALGAALFLHLALRQVRLNQAQLAA
jgi:O-antigen/teichoic acid export membrane protein